MYPVASKATILYISYDRGNCPEVDILSSNKHYG